MHLVQSAHLGTLELVLCHQFHSLDDYSALLACQVFRSRLARVVIVSMVVLRTFTELAVREVSGHVGLARHHVCHGMLRPYVHMIESIVTQ
jgi:hypothetical protein